MCRIFMSDDDKEVRWHPKFIIGLSQVETILLAQSSRGQAVVRLIAIIVQILRTPLPPERIACIVGAMTKALVLQSDSPGSNPGCVYHFLGSLSLLFIRHGRN